MQQLIMAAVVQLPGKVEVTKKWPELHEVCVEQAVLAISMSTVAGHLLARVMSFNTGVIADRSCSKRPRQIRLHITLLDHLGIVPAWLNCDYAFAA
jgi:hypothetical protein